jgi:hypothetical protein
MNEDEAEQLASMVTEEWTEAPPSFFDDTTAPVVKPKEPRVGSYWPIGSPGPVEGTAVRSRVNFIGSKALGTSLLFCFTLDGEPRQYLLCFDLAETPANDFRVLSGSVFVAVIRDWLPELGGNPTSCTLSITFPDHRASGEIGCLAVAPSRRPGVARSRGAAGATSCRTALPMMPSLPPPPHVIALVEVGGMVR